MVNEREKKVIERYKGDGWIAIRGGAPDFLFLRTEGGEIVNHKFVEVKSPSSNLTYEQEIWRKVVEKSGVKYEVEVVE